MKPVKKAERTGAAYAPSSVRFVHGDMDSVSFEILGTYEEMKELEAYGSEPPTIELMTDLMDDEGYDVASLNLESTGGGMARLTYNLVKMRNDISQGIDRPLRTTIRIDMEEVTYDLEDHPYLAGTYRDICLKWLATDEAARVETVNSETSYYYLGSDGEMKLIDDPRVLGFCRAYMAGIRSFRRYYPVVERTSIWRKPPGMDSDGQSYKTGSPDFSEGLGTYDDPPVTLNGYPAGNWFKSRDGWQQQERRNWVRTEQWTYTPEGENGGHGWIYQEL